MLPPMHRPIKNLRRLEQLKPPVPGALSFSQTRFNLTDDSISRRPSQSRLRGSNDHPTPGPARSKPSGDKSSQSANPANASSPGSSDSNAVGITNSVLPSDMTSCSPKPGNAFTKKGIAANTRLSASINCPDSNSSLPRALPRSEGGESNVAPALNTRGVEFPPDLRIHDDPRVPSRYAP